MGYAFISYCSENQQMAESLRALFKLNDIETWMAPGDIPFDSAFAATINHAIDDASCFVLLLSESVQEPQWAAREAERADSAGKTIFTVQLDDVPMSDDFMFELSTSQAVAIRKINENSDYIKRLVQAVAAHTSELKNEENAVDNTATVKEQNSKADDENYFRENAIMKGSTLKDFRGKQSAKVVIPEGVTVIGDRAFSFHAELLEISIPSSVKKIEEYAFVQCPELCSITVDPQNPVFRSEGNCCIERATNRLVFGCHTSKIPDGVTVIGSDAFDGCKNLTAIDIPSSVRRIEKGAFFECINLSALTFAEGVAEIEEMAFSCCDSLTELNLPSSITKIATGAFHNRHGFEAIHVSRNNSVYHSENNCCIETRTNRLVLGSNTGIIPNGTVVIGERAFEDCQALKRIQIPSSVKVIDAGAFNGCSGLTSVVITAGLEINGEDAFRCCSGITSILIPDSVSEIGYKAFMSCSRLKSIRVSPKNPVYRSEDDCCIRKEDNVLVFGCMHSIIPNGVTEIDEYAFSGCVNLTDIYLPDSIKKISDHAFWGCLDLASIDLPDSIHRIGKSAFDSCGLTSIEIPSSVKHIGANAFCDCDELLDIFIPDSVQYIGEYAFGGYERPMERRTIYCEASKKPVRWHDEWTDQHSDVYWAGEW